jgi:hypothetical protein
MLSDECLVDRLFQGRDGPSLTLTSKDAGTLLHRGPAVPAPGKSNIDIAS